MHCEREGLKYESSGSNGFRNSGGGTWTMASRARQKIASFFVVAINDPGSAEQWRRV
jgi:hypothetical protein